MHSATRKGRSHASPTVIKDIFFQSALEKKKKEDDEVNLKCVWPTEKLRMMEGDEVDGFDWKD